MKIRGYSIFFIGIIFFFINCSKTPNIDELLKEGKEYLEKGEGGKALEIYQEVLQIDSKNSEAYFGSSLAQIQEIFQLIYTLVDLITTEIPEIDFEGSTLSEAIPKILQNLSLDAIIDLSIQQLIMVKLNDIANNTDRIIDLENFSFKISSYPIKIFARPYTKTFNIRGEFDSSDVALINGLSNFFLGIIDFICALNLDFNMEPLLKIDLNQNLFLIYNQILNIFIKEIFPDPNYPDFLKIKERGGEAFLKLSYLSFQKGTESLILGINRLEADNLPSEDEVLTYIDLNKNDKYDKNEPISFNRSAPLYIPLQDIKNLFISIDENFKNPYDPEKLYDNVYLQYLILALLDFPFKIDLPRGCKICDLNEFFIDPLPDKVRNIVIEKFNLLSQINAFLISEGISNWEEFTSYIYTTNLLNSLNIIVNFSQIMAQNVEEKGNENLIQFINLLGDFFIYLETYPKSLEKIVDKMIYLLSYLDIYVDSNILDYLNNLFIYLENMLNSSSYEDQEKVEEILISFSQICYDLAYYWEKHPEEITQFFYFSEEFFSELIISLEKILNWEFVIESDKIFQFILEIHSPYEEIFNRYGYNIFCLSQAIWEGISDILRVTLPYEKFSRYVIPLSCTIQGMKLSL